MNDAINSQGATARKARTYHGSCFCGAVQFTVSGEPAGMGYCHCESCRSWSAGPVNAFTLWKPEAVQVTQGAEQHRHVTTRRRTAIASGARPAAATSSPSIPAWGSSTCTRRSFRTSRTRPGVHVNYQETKLRIKDGLPKMKDVPKEMGGSGVLIAE